jgi:hypothetical protein
MYETRFGLYDLSNFTREQLTREVWQDSFAAYDCEMLTEYAVEQANEDEYDAGKAWDEWHQ